MIDILRRKVARVTAAIRNDEMDGEVRVGRLDFSVLSKMDSLERTPTGGVRIPARLGRSGVLVYRRQDGSLVREYRPDSEAFAPETLSSADDAVVTVGHPSTGMVTPSNAKTLSVGHVRGAARKDGSFMAASLAVVDGSAIDAIGRGDLVELSSGYTCRIDETPGRTPDGEPYDRIQRDVRLNHAALLPAGAGRAGRDVSLRFDGLEIRIDEDDSRTKRAPAPAREPEVKADSMKTERIDGVDYEIGTQAWHQARERHAASEKTRFDALEREMQELKDKLTAETARADSAEGKVKKLEERLTPKAIDDLVSARATLTAKASAVLGPETKLDGKSEHEIRLAVIQKIDPTFKVDSIEESQRELYARARFDADTRALTSGAPAGSASTPLARAKAAVLPSVPPTLRADAQSKPGEEPYVPLMQRLATGHYSGPGLTR